MPSVAGSKRSFADTIASSSTRPCLTANTACPSNAQDSVFKASSRGRTRTAASTINAADQTILCALSERRGVCPVISLAILNLSTFEAVLCQLTDDRTFTRTEQKLVVYQPSEILLSTAMAQSELHQSIKKNLSSIRATVLDKKAWSEGEGASLLEKLTLPEELDALKLSLQGKSQALACLAAVILYAESEYGVKMMEGSIRGMYEAPESTMMIDPTSIRVLELVACYSTGQAKGSLRGVLDHTQTRMGARLLRQNILQPSTDETLLTRRYEAVAELTRRQDIFFALRQGLKSFVDTDRVLTAITVDPGKVTIKHFESRINHVIMLKQFVKAIPAIFEALSDATSDLLRSIAQICDSENIAAVEAVIDTTINKDTTYQSKPLDLRNQRTYAVKAGVHGMLDVARQTYKEANADAVQLTEQLCQVHKIHLNMKYEPARGYYFRLDSIHVRGGQLPKVFINVVMKKAWVECQTMDLLKLNRRIVDAHDEVVQLSDDSINHLVTQIREDIAPLFRISQALALLDMILSFAHLAITKDYVRPELTDVLALNDARHPVLNEICEHAYIPNDFYATPQRRFQIITGSNMSGKSIYIRTVALITIIAQIGCFVPATYASIRVSHHLFTRISIDDTLEPGLSTFSAEMCEAAFILRNIDHRSLVIVDELGRGTSTRDGLSIAIAIAEALIDSRALIWFATHFIDLARALAERNGVVNLHLQVDFSGADGMTMLYRIAEGWEEESDYGIYLAKSMGLPAEVIEVAELVTQEFRERKAKQFDRNTLAAAVARRQRLLLETKETLEQTVQGNMRDDDLAAFLKGLQADFIQKMTVADADISAAEAKEANEAEEAEIEAASVANAKVNAKERGSTSHELPDERRIPCMEDWQEYYEAEDFRLPCRDEENLPPDAVSWTQFFAGYLPTAPVLTTRNDPARAS